MKRVLLLAAGLLFAAGAQAADGWAGLWHTPDQRGEQLMRQGDAAAAAQTYSDPRRKAYAELQAGDYATAAKGFGGFDDSDAHYDRGNALARAGDLQQALKAYDTALQRNPDNRDAKHNRDLVEQALKQQQSKQQQSSNQQQQKDQQQKDQQQQDHQQQSQGSGQSQSGKDGKDGKPDQAQKDQPGQDQKDQPGQQNQQQADARNNNGKQGQQNPSAQQQQDQAGQSGQQDQDKAKEAEQARRDAANSLDRQPQQPAAQATQQQTGDGARGGEPRDNPVAAKPATEQQLAQEQWLRRIPDDPGGLLRRKFMIEHMMRQKGQQQDQQDQQP